MTAITLSLKSLVDLTDEAFYELCRTNADVKFERTATGDLVITSPTGGETGDRNRRLTQQLGNWTDADNTGLSFDSSIVQVSPSKCFSCLKRCQVKRSCLDLSST